MRRLIERVEARFGGEESAYRPEGAVYAFRRDLRRLRGLGCRISFLRSRGVYRLESPPFFLRLSPPELAAIPLLRRIFSPSVPYAKGVHSLLARVEQLLPEGQRRRAREPRLSSDFGVEEGLSPQERDIARIEEAIGFRQEMEFRYRAPGHGEKGCRVEPVELRLYGRHFYLRAYDRRLGGYREFRVDRILPGTVSILPSVLPPGERRARIWTLKHKMSPDLAAYGITRRFPGQREERQEDGSVIVTAEVESLFEAMRE